MAKGAIGSISINEDQGATFVELFFDLVFVFAVTQVTGLVLHDLTLAGIGRAILIFWMIWWAWTQFTWALNPADTDNAMVRLWTLAATGVAFVMAVSVGDAFEDGGVLFAAAYVTGRVIGLGLYYKVSSEIPEMAKAVRFFSVLSIGGLILAMVGGFVAPELRVWFWLGVVLLDLVAAGLAGNRGEWGLHAGHFAERHGLFVIIALGESLVAAGVAAAHQELTTPLFLVALGAVAVTCLLWWSYFGWLKEELEEELNAREGAGQSSLARDAYSILHFPMIAGIIAIAVGIEAMVAHPGDILGSESLVAFAVGILLFVGSAAAAWARAGRAVLWSRMATIGATVTILFLLPSPKPLWILGITSAALLGILVLEFGRCNHSTDAATN